jgi:hypothetical protein
MQGESSPAYARRKAVLRNREVRLSLDRAEARILEAPDDLRSESSETTGQSSTAMSPICCSCTSGLTMTR